MDEGGGDDTKVKVLDLADHFRYQKIEGGMSKKAYQGELKSASKDLVSRSSEQYS